MEHSHLRSYQKEFITCVMKELEGNKKRISAYMPTSSGKSRTLTVLFYELLYSQTHRNILLLTPSLAVSKSFMNTLDEVQVSNHLSFSSIYTTKELKTNDTNNDETDSVTISTINKVVNNPSTLDGYDFIAFYDVLNKLNIKVIEHIENANRDIKCLSLSSFPTDSQETLFGPPVFSYSIQDAIADDYFEIPKITPVEAFSNRVPITREGIKQAIESILLENEFTPNRKLVVICKNSSEATLVHEELQLFNNEKINFNNYLILSKSNDSRSNIKRFVNERGPSIAVSVNMMLQGVDGHIITDVILMKDFSSMLELRLAYSLVFNKSIQFQEQKTLWDFHDNSKLLNQIFSEIDVPQKHNDSSFHLDPKRIKPNGDSVSNEDYLDRSNVIHALNSLVEFSSNNNQFKPFVFGLFGKWGTGKSTIINLLKERLKPKREFNFIEYNAWQNEHCTSMTASIANCIVTKLYEEKSLPHRCYLALKSQLFLKKDSVAISLILFPALLIAAIFLGDPKKVSTVELTGVSQVLNDYKSLISFCIFSLAASWSFFKHPFSSKLKKLAQKPGFSQHLGISEEIKEQVHSLLDAKSKYTFSNAIGRILNKGSNKQFVLVIDDLDRCERKNILQILEAVRVLSERPDIIVIICVDKHVLLNAVEYKYSEDGKINEQSARLTARNFLAKIFQLSYELVDTESNKINHFITNRLYPTSNVKKQLEVKVGNNGKVRTLNNEDVDDIDIEFDELTSKKDIKISLSDDFVLALEGEQEQFEICTGLFKLHNPRTLIRLHNSITLLKGLHPKYTVKMELFYQLIFVTFYFEHICSNELSKSSSFAEIFKDKPDINKHLESIKLNYHSITFDQILSNVENVSLPMVNET